MRILAALAILMALSGCVEKHVFQLIHVTVMDSNGTRVSVIDVQEKPVTTDVGRAAQISVPILP